jgi:hypothetical protein
LADLEWEGLPDRHSLRRAIRHRLRRFDPTIRVVAEGFLSEGTAIDLLAVGGEGELVGIRIACDEDDAVLFTRALADLTWLRPRAADLLKLAPGLGLEPSAEPRAMLFSRRFTPHTLAAAENFPSRTIELLSYHCLRQHGQLSVVIETWAAAPTITRTHVSIDDAGRTEPDRRPIAARNPMAGHRSEVHRSVRQTAMAGPSSFRTGLSDCDLRTESEEIKILD